MPSILETLGALPSGEVRRLTPDQLTRYLRDRWHPSHTSEKDRRREMRIRLDLFKDRGRSHIDASLHKIFKSPKVLAWRKELVEFAEFQNLTKRIVREISTVYAEPAKRTISKGQKRYKEFQGEIRQDRIMRKVNRLGNLTNNVLVMPDLKASGPVLRTITQDKFTAIPHPNDPLEAIAYIVDQFPSGPYVRPTDAHYLGMTDAEYFWLDMDWRLVRMEPHQLGTMPAILWSREEPDECILDASSGKDLISAHLCVALLNVMLLKNQKSGAKMPYITGDTSNIPSDQTMDEESMLIFDEGQSPGTLDVGADPTAYINATRAVIKQVAANWGIPESVFDLSYQATSGFEIELKRVGLREIRRDQILDFRDFERKLAVLWSRILTMAESDWAFDPTGFAIDFGEIDTPQEPMAKLTYWKTLEEMGLANTVAMYMEMNPEASEEDAIKAVTQNLELRLTKMRAFQRENSGVFTPNRPGGQPRDGVQEPEEETQQEEAA